MLLTNRLRQHLDPWRVLQEFERQWNDQAGGLGGLIDAAAQAWAHGPFRMWSRDGSIVLELDLPGCAPDSIDLSVQQKTLTIETRAADAAIPETAEFHVRERVDAGRREFRLPFDVDPQRTEAEYVNGMMRVTLHQPESQRPARIEVKSR